jgi:hypothetical protein
MYQSVNSFFSMSQPSRYIAFFLLLLLLFFFFFFFFVFSYAVFQKKQTQTHRSKGKKLMSKARKKTSQTKSKNFCVFLVVSQVKKKMAKRLSGGPKDARLADVTRADLRDGHITAAAAVNK